MNVRTIRIDKGAASVLALCPCGWRTVGASEANVISHALAHAHQSHPNDRSIRRNVEHRQRKGTQ